MPTCSVRGCKNPVRSNGLCHMHHQRWVRHGNPLVVLRKQNSVGVAVPEDWRERFIRAYDIEFQEWIDGIAGGGQFGPSSWDGYAAAAVSDAAVEALHDDSRVVIKLIDKPELYR